MEVNSECLGMGGWPHFGHAGSGQVSSVAGPALDSVAALVQLPEASLGIPAAPLLQQALHPLAQRGLSTPLAPPGVTAVSWYPARLLEGMGVSIIRGPCGPEPLGWDFFRVPAPPSRQTTSPPA